MIETLNEKLNWHLSSIERTDAEAVTARLNGYKKLGVAYSGGVDSALLLAIAVHALDAENVVAVTADSGLLPRSELELARRTAEQIGARMVEFKTNELANPNFVANDADRCYVCKNAMFTLVDDELVAKLDLDAVAYGENSDDTLAPDRPGARAAAEHKVLRPLADAGLTKERVRGLARAIGLSVADKPSAPCLATRIPHGTPITEEKLRQIEAAEEAVYAAGFSDCRVRHHEEIARVEVPLDEFHLLADEKIRAGLVEGVKKAGFRYVTLDLSGMQRGAFTMQILREKK